MSNADKKLLLKKIFVYHSIPQSQELNEVWLDDLSEFSVFEIKTAWDAWRKDGGNERRKPTSWELAKVIKARTRPLGMLAETAPDRLQRGRSLTEDLLIERLAHMQQTHQNLMGTIKNCERANEKLLVCFMALDQNLADNEWANLMIKKINAQDNG